MCETKPPILKMGQNRRLVIIQIASFFHLGEDKNCSRQKRSVQIIANKQLHYQYTNEMFLTQNTQTHYNPAQNTPRQKNFDKK